MAQVASKFGAKKSKAGLGQEKLDNNNMFVYGWIVTKFAVVVHK